MPDSMITLIETWEREGNYGRLMFADRIGLPFPWNNTVKQKLSHSKVKDAPFPSILAEVPGVDVVAELEDALNKAQVETKEDEADEVIHNTDLDCEVPHLTFGQQDDSFEEHNSGDVDMIEETDATTNECMHDINAVHGHCNNAIKNLIEELNQAQDNLDNLIAEIYNTEHGNDTAVKENDNEAPRWLTSTSAQYNEDNSRHDISEMTQLEVVEQIVGLVFMQYSLKVGLREFKEAGKAALNLNSSS